MKTILKFSLLFVMFQITAQVKVSSGSIKSLLLFESKFVDARNVDIWLPDGYSEKEKYAVLYMHDGQMLYDAEASWNKTSWEADETAAKLMAENKTRKFIIVGIWNTVNKRHAEYFPQKPYESIPAPEKQIIIDEIKKLTNTTEVFQPKSDNYLKFIVNELKPFIDKTFSVKPDRNNTFIAGSSMGGLISLYAICEYPEVFGGAACISTHWPGTFSVENNPIPDAFFNYMASDLPDPKTHRIYFDYGDQTLDAMYPPLQKKADLVMKNKGYASKNWITKSFPGAEHSEKAWKERLHFPMEFLLSK